MGEQRTYDIFISYRHDGGEHLAKNLRDALTERGYRVFFDIESLRTGKFNEKLFEVIKSSARFMLVLTPHALDRCSNEDDWVRKEIECALENDIPIVPILSRGFTFPKTLPESINEVRFFHGPAASAEYFDAFLDKLEEFLPDSSPKESARKPFPLYRALALLLVILCVGGFFLYRHLSIFPHNQMQKSIVSETINYLVLNMTQADVSQKAYIDALKSCRDYLSNPERFSRDNIDRQIDYALSTIANASSAIRPLDASLNERIMGTPLGNQEIYAQADGLNAMLNGMTSTLNHLNDLLIDDFWLLNTSKITYIDVALEIAETDCDILFYLLNETLLPVDSSALTELKTKQLPLMTSIYDGQTFIDDEAELEGLINRVYARQDELIRKLEVSVGEEQRLLDYEVICDQIYAQHKPLRSDDLDTLWKKALRFTACGMYSEAAECYDMYANKDTTTLGKVLALTAELFVLKTSETGIMGGCLVAGYEEGMPQQPVKIGDIIYAVNGVPVRTFSEYVDQKAKHASHTLSIMRLSGGETEFLEVTLDPQAGLLSLYSLNEDFPQ